MGGGWDAGVSRAQGGQCRGKEPAGSPWTAWRACWQEPSSVSHQPHQTHCLLLAVPFSWALWSRGPWHRGHLKGRLSLGRKGRQMMPVGAWRSPPVWGSLCAAKDESRSPL